MKEIDVNDTLVHTSLTITVVGQIEITIKNLQLEELAMFSNKIELLELILIKVPWYQYGVYDNVVIEALHLEFTVIKFTKAKLELLVRNRIP